LRHVDAPASAIDESLPAGLTLEYQCDLAGIHEDDHAADKPQFCGQQEPRLLLGMTPYAPLPLCSRLEAPPRFQIVPLAAREPKPGRRQAVKAEAAKRGRDSVSLYGLTPVRFTVAGSKPTADVIWPHRARASGAMRRDRQSSG
jgi:hypothetical protein